MRRSSALAFALALVLGLAGCGRGGAQDSAAAAPVALLNGGNPPSFLAQIADAPFRTAYYARRHVWQVFRGASGAETLEYTERVWSDGLGNFSVTPEEVLQPAMSRQDLQVFLLLQKAREGFLYRLRDFRIQELSSFLVSYTIQDLSQHITVAGQPCERLRVDPVAPGQGHWELDVDPTNGLILATREFLHDGTLVSVVETLEYDATPDLGAVSLHQDLPAVPFTKADARRVLGYEPLRPGFLPEGFELVKSDKVTQAGQDWARFQFSNGGESLFLLYRHDPAGSAPTDDSAGPYTIKVFRAGRWNVAQAEFGREHITVLGREHVDVLEQVIQSCIR